MGREGLCGKIKVQNIYPRGENTSYVTLRLN